ncbi:MAG: hypothetical protein R6U26_03175 [Candidatus Undinarchaeales archaeon]
MHKLLKKLGISETIAAVLMIVLGFIIVLFEINDVTLLSYLIALYLIAVGLLKLLPEKS